MIKKETRLFLKPDNVSDENKTELQFYFHEIKRVFDTNVEEITTDRLLDKFQQIPRVLRKFIKNNIVPDFQMFTQYTRNLNILRTTNCNENYYRQILLGELKRKYKTSNRITSYLQKQMQKWT